MTTSSPLDKRLRVLVIDAGLPNPEFDAGSRAILDFISIVKEGSRGQNPELHFLAMGHNPWGRASDLKAMQVQIHEPSEALKLPEDQACWLNNLSPDIVVISRPGPASQWLSAVIAHTILKDQIKLTAQTKPTARKPPSFFYYGHDIHHQRLEQELLFDPQPAVVQQQKLYQALEPVIWKQFDKVIYGSKNECTRVNSLFPNKAVYLPLYVTRQAAAGQYFSANPNPNPNPNLNDVLWVGGAHHAPNRDGLSWLIGQVFPRVTAAINLHVAGDWPQTLMQQALYQPKHKQHKVRWLGRLSQSQLDEAYESCSFAVAPLRFGAGVKGKVFEALSKGCPVLTTAIGMQGFEHLAWPKPCISEPESQVFSQKLEQLLAISPKQRFAPELHQMRLTLTDESGAAPGVWENLLQSSLLGATDYVY